MIRTCVSWPADDVDALIQMIDAAIQITRRTFLQHVDRTELRYAEHGLGYCGHPKHGLTMAGDYHVSYHRSKLHGETVYYFRHSAIEYIFLP